MASTLLRCARQVVRLSSGTSNVRCAASFGLPARQQLRLFSGTTPIYAGRQFSEDHEWVVLEGNIGTVGISDHAQDQLGDIVYVECPEPGRECDKGEAIATVESVKAVSEVFSPVSGTIVEINTALADDPAKINRSCYNEGWLYKIDLTNPSELENLMDEPSYKKFLENMEE